MVIMLFSVKLWIFKIYIILIISIALSILNGTMDRTSKFLEKGAKIFFSITSLN